jgi:hypothetical protein
MPTCACLQRDGLGREWVEVQCTACVGWGSHVGCGHRGVPTEKVNGKEVRLVCARGRERVWGRTQGGNAFVPHQATQKHICIAVYCCVLQCVDVYCCVLLCIAVCCCVLQCIAVYCCVLLCVDVYCSVLLCVDVYCSVLMCIAACCSVLLCIAVYCCALMCITVYCSVLMCIAAC